MKIKYIHTINKVSLLITLICYLGLYLGAIVQIGLGFIQILLALILLVKWQLLVDKTKTLVAVYWFLVLIYGSVYLFFEGNLNLGLIYWIFIPLVIAGYFVFVTHKINDQLKH